MIHDEGLWVILPLLRKRDENIRISNIHGHSINRDSMVVGKQSRSDVLQSKVNPLSRTIFLIFFGLILGVHYSSRTALMGLDPGRAAMTR